MEVKGFKFGTRVEDCELWGAIDGYWMMVVTVRVDLVCGTTPMVVPGASSTYPGVELLGKIKGSAFIGFLRHKTGQVRQLRNGILLVREKSVWIVSVGDRLNCNPPTSQRGQAKEEDMKTVQLEDRSVIENQQLCVSEKPKYHL